MPILHAYTAIRIHKSSTAPCSNRDLDRHRLRSTAGRNSQSHQKVECDRSPSTKAFGVVTDPSIQRLDGKVAIVTGGGKGIGRSEALLMAQQGAKVVVSDVGVDERVRRADTVVSEINGAGGHAVAAADDLATFDGARQVVATALDHFGGLDIVINNAGLRAANAIQDITDEDFDIVVGSHLKATYGMIKYAAPIFLEQGSGVILNTSSESGLGHPYNSAYAAAKEGITGLTRTVARELGTCGVRCNQIRPRARGHPEPRVHGGVDEVQAPTRCARPLHPRLPRRSQSKIPPRRCRRTGSVAVHRRGSNGQRPRLLRNGRRGRPVVRTRARASHHPHRWVDTQPSRRARTRSPHPRPP